MTNFDCRKKFLKFHRKYEESKHYEIKNFEQWEYIRFLLGTESQWEH